MRSAASLALPFSLWEDKSTLYIDLPQRLATSSCLERLLGELVACPGETPVLLMVDGNPLEEFADMQVALGPRLYRALNHFAHSS